MNGAEIVLENRYCRLVLGTDGRAKSLTVGGTECLCADEDVSLFSVTQERPFNNEVKLAHPNKRASYPASRVRREGDRLIVGFETVPVVAEIGVKVAEEYIAFTLIRFIVEADHYDHLCMDKPPVAKLTLLQLPVAGREHFGDWLNVLWDDAAAVCVLAADPYVDADSVRRREGRILSADVSREFGMQNRAAVLVAAPKDALMTAIDRVEQDFGLPRGVESRRNPLINASIYHSGNITPENVDEHIRYALAGGFRLMLVYYTSVFKEGRGYTLCGNYDYRDEYPNGPADLKRMLDKIRAAGLVPGIHFLQTHIGLRSRYVTPVADHRLRLTRHFTLSEPLDGESTTVYVENNPALAPMADKCRILKFGGELIAYEGYTTERPYRFTGCTRGYLDTRILEHPRGEIGGVLDVSEFGGTSCYLDQDSGLQEEIGRKLAEAYACGFEFCYFDGSEGVSPPFNVHVSGAQYRVYRMLDRAPVFTEGAAKTHFGWHYLSGGNAFDVFPPPVFKAMIDRFPAEEAPRMRDDFTRVNFGWWGYYLPGQSPETEPGTQPDMLEYGTSRAAAWDCPATITTVAEKYAQHPRTADNLEVMRRWEEVRATGWLTEEMKRELRKPGQEHILLINEEREYELVPCRRITEEGPGVRAFLFERRGAAYAVYWHTSGEGTLRLPLTDGDAEVRDELWSQPVEIRKTGGLAEIPLGGRRYLKARSAEALIAAFRAAEAVTD